MHNLVKFNLKTKKVVYNNNVATRRRNKEKIKMKNEKSMVDEVTEEWKAYLHWCVEYNKVPTLYKNFREFMNTHFKNKEEKKENE